MKPKRTSVAEATPIRVVIISLDGHVANSVTAAERVLRDELPGLELRFHAATSWDDNPDALEACRADIAAGDIIFANMLFMEDHIRAVLPDLQARRDHCDAMVCCISSGEVIRLTRLGGFDMGKPQKGPMKLLAKLRGSKKNKQSSGAQQMAMLRRLPRILRFIPGTAQDVRAYFLTLQYWLSSSDENVVNMVRFLVSRYADETRAHLKDAIRADAPIEYPDEGLYHPRLAARVTEDLDAIPAPPNATGTVGLLVMRSYVLSRDTAHYDAVIAALEARGLKVICAFASGLDARPAVERFFVNQGEVTIDLLLSLTGFSLVGGPAFNDSAAAEELLARLDVPYVAAHAIEFATIEQWSDDARGLTPIEATMMVAIPELDGATGPLVFGGRSEQTDGGAPRMQGLPDRVQMLAARVQRLIDLRHTPRAERNLAIVVFNFPPNGGATGTAAFLSVFESLHRTLLRLRDEGYDVEVPATVEALRGAIVEGNAERLGTDANVHARIAVDDHVRREPHLEEIEAQWGPAPGRHQTDGRSIFVFGAQFGRVFVGVQPAFGYEGDPMRLLFEEGFAPTHAFSSFYRWIREDFGAHAVLHFGTHGALEFMPGKQCGLSSACWPDRLIHDLPNLYLYAANNPSEGTLAKRRSAATLISHLTPPIARAGLYRGLLELQDSLARFRGLPPDASERLRMIPLIQAQAATIDLCAVEPKWNGDAEQQIQRIQAAVYECEQTLIPSGMHVIGAPPTFEQRVELIATMAQERLGASGGVEIASRALLDGDAPKAALQKAGIPTTRENLAHLADLAATNRLLSEDHELPALVRALDGGFIRPVSGGDLLRNPQVLPTGRNLHGFDPYRIPSAFAVVEGAAQAEELLRRHEADGHPLPQSVALVLWGTDNLKTEGGPIGQALALLGAHPRFDSYGRLCGAGLVSLEALGRPRIDVVVTLSGIFRDLLPLQTRLLAEAAYLAALADEPPELNFVRRNALAYQAEHGCDLETAALRVFSNAHGAYGSNVNHLIDSGAWEDEDQLGETYARRKCFAYGRNGRPQAQRALLEATLANVDLAYQNLESVELGVTTIDHYFDTLGGISRVARRAKGGAAMPVYIGDATCGPTKVRTLDEQVALESRTRTLNPKWYEAMLEHGAEGVRQIEAHVTNTMGWSATTGQVAPWVYEQLSTTFVLDPEMRERMAKLNPKASAKLANRLLEAQDRAYWRPDSSMLEALRMAGEELEDRLEGISAPAA